MVFYFQRIVIDSVSFNNLCLRSTSSNYDKKKITNRILSMVTFRSHVAHFCAECVREAPSVEHERNLSAEDAPAGIDRKTKGIKIAGKGVTQTSATTSDKGETRT